MPEIKTNAYVDTFKERSVDEKSFSVTREINDSKATKAECNSPPADNRSLGVETNVPATPVSCHSLGLDTKPKVEAQLAAEVPTLVPRPSRAAVRWKARVHFFVTCFVLFLAGWDGGTIGPLLPRLQEHYYVNYTVVSLIFVTNSIGYLVGAAANVYLNERWGFGKVMLLGSTLQLVALVVMAAAPPFPVLCVMFFFDGWGLSLQDAQSNSYVVSFSENPEAKMNIMHALFGLGALCSPFSATQFAKLPQYWSLHFCVSAAVALMNTVFLAVVFRGKTQNECLAEIDEAPVMSGTSEKNVYKQILRQKILHLLAIFSLVYVGLEFTIGGWTVTYIITQRHGGPTSGFVSTGFFSGLTLGRVLLILVNKKVGEHAVMYIYMIIVIGLQLVVWLVPSIVGDAIAESFVGFFIGPIYPILMNETSRLIPPWLLPGSMGWIASIGFAGSALFPFITGALSSKFGTMSMQPLTIALMVSVLALWALVTNGGGSRHWQQESTITGRIDASTDGSRQL